MQTKQILAARVAAVCLLVGTLAGPQSAFAETMLGWQRTKRVAVCESPRRARYPSIARAADGLNVVPSAVSNAIELVEAEFEHIQ